jgi:hypothetical protein
VVIEGYGVEDQIGESRTRGPQHGLGASGAFGEMQPEDRRPGAGGESFEYLGAETRLEAESSGHYAAEFQEAASGDAPFFEELVSLVHRFLLSTGNKLRK